MQSEFITRFHNLAFSEKKKYLKFIYNIGKSGLINLFKFPGENFSLWWFSLIAEKSTFKTDSYDRLIFYLLSPEKKPIKKPIRKLIRESALFQFFIGFYSLYSFIRKVIYAKIFIKDFKRRQADLFDNDYTMVSYFPLLDKDKAKDNIFENKYIAPFHRLLEGKRKGKYAHICFHVDIDGLNFKDSVRLINKFYKTQSIFLLEEIFKLRHIFSILFYYLYFSFLFIFNINRIKKNILYEYEGKNYNVWHIFKNDFYISFCGNILASSLCYIYIFKELASCLKKNSIVICMCEMLWWEKALYVYTKKYGLISIGYQHTIVPELLLNYFNHPDEIRVSNGKNGRCPLPDYMTTVGNIPAKLFKKYGWPDERVFVWGAQRFESLKDIDKLFIPWEYNENYFICAFSISISEAERVLLMLEEAFKKAIVNYKIYLKSHPAINLQHVVKKLGLELNSEVFEFTEVPLDRSMQKAKGIIVTESSSCLYALAYGSPVIVPRFENRIDCNPLSYISNIPIYADSAEDLRNICDQIVNLPDSPVIDAEIKKFLNDYLCFPVSDSEYLDKIDSLVQLKN
jgi:surface carbohydrate biosynthesis protein (TIGR04326 family)